MSAMPARHVITADKYELMVEAGAFTGDRVELMLGEIFDMSPIGSAHQACVNRLNRAFASLFVRGEAIVQVRGSIRLDELSEPQPDVALLKPRDDYYAGAHPTPRDVLLVVEVADSSIRYDRLTKMPVYAAAGIPEAWLVDLHARVIEVSTGPSARGYREMVEFKPGQAIEPARPAGLSVPVDEVLGRG